MYHDVSNSKGTCPRGPVQEPVRGASSSWKCVRTSATRIQGPVPVQGPEQEDPCRETAKKKCVDLCREICAKETRPEKAA